MMCRLIAACACLATPVFGEVDPCVTGSWRVDPESFETQFKQASGAEEAFIEGGLILFVGSDGQSSFTLSELVISSRVPGQPRTVMILNGGSEFTLDPQDQVFISVLDRMRIDVELHIPDLAGVPPMEMTFTEEDLEGVSGMFATVSGAYTCNETELVLLPEDEGSIPYIWYRTEATE